MKALLVLVGSFTIGIVLLYFCVSCFGYAIEHWDWFNDFISSDDDDWDDDFYLSSLTIDYVKPKKEKENKLEKYT